MVSVEGRRLYLLVFYRGPWERVVDVLLRTHEGAREVKDNSLRERLSRWPEHRDHVWRERYVQSGQNPHRIWRRRVSR